MERFEYDCFHAEMLHKLDSTHMEFRRDIHRSIDWSNRLIGIKGPKGVGKTTLLLQHIKDSFSDLSKVLYVSMDNLWLSYGSIADLVDFHYTHGGTHVFLDDIHRYGAWQRAVKNIYDDYPSLKVAYAGSSMMKMHSPEADLSRRQRAYDMPGLSFREFLRSENALEYRILSLDEILENHMGLSMDICSRIKVMPLFEKYLKTGYYPFYREEAHGFPARLEEMVRIGLDRDLPSNTDMEYASLQKARKMFMLLISKVPYAPRMKDVFDAVGTNREHGYMILDALEKAGLLRLLKTRSKDSKPFARPERIFPDNTCLMYAFTGNPDLDDVRRAFFMSQLSNVHTVNYPQKGDFLVDSRYTFEVGGRRKSFDQIKDMPDSFLAVDGIETGSGNRIPLWLFGFMW